MKKTVIIILAILPIFLLITIAFAGRVISLYQHISVERVVFIDDDGAESAKITVNIGESVQTKIKIYPEYATNKTVWYFSEDETIFTVDGGGVVTGVSFGTATLIVKSQDGSKTSMLLVKVTQDNVTGVSFPQDTLTIVVGDKVSLQAMVTPYVALNKSVVYSSSDTNVVFIDANGTVTAIAEGQATVKVKTVDGGFEDTCLVTCVQGVSALYFDMSEDENFEKKGNGYTTDLSEIYLSNYLKYDEERVIIDEVKFRIRSGGNMATLTGDKLTVTGKGIITVIAYVGSQESPDFQAELRLMID